MASLIQWSGIIDMLKYAICQSVTWFGAFHPQAAEGNEPWTWYRYTWTVAICTSTLYTFYWDVKMDWNLLERSCSKMPRPVRVIGDIRTGGLAVGLLQDGQNFEQMSRDYVSAQRTAPTLLRSTLLYEPTCIYYCAIGVDLLLRCSWSLTLLPGDFNPFFGGWYDSVGYELYVAGIMAAELMRRGMWGLFRVEKAHINQQSQFDEYKFIPMFHEMSSKVRHHRDQGWSWKTLIQVLIMLFVVTVVMILSVALNE